MKDPDAHAGEKYVIYGVVFQFDAATGADTFLADTGAVRSSDPYDFGVRTIVNAKDASLLANVVENDEITMWVEVLGSVDYDTQEGGATTVPQLRVGIIQVTNRGS